MKKYIQFKKYVWGGSAGGRASAGFKYQWSEERGEMYSVASAEQAKDIMLQLREGMRIDFSYLAHFDDTHVDLLSYATDRDLLGPSHNVADVECLLHIVCLHWEFSNIVLVALFVERLQSVHRLTIDNIVGYVTENTGYDYDVLHADIIELLSAKDELV